MNKKNSDREETKRLIIEASAELFNKKGVLGTSLSDIEKATKLTKGSIYGNFKNKEEVALQSFRYSFNLLGEQISSRVRMAKNQKGKLLAYVRFYQQYHEFHFSRGGCPILNAGVDADDANEEILEEVRNVLQIWQEAIERIINKGNAQKEWESDVDAEGFAYFFISLVEGSIFLAKTRNEMKPLMSNMNYLEKIIQDF